MTKSPVPAGDYARTRPVLQNRLQFLLIIVTILAACISRVTGQGDASPCADRTMKGTCGACGICCCYKGPLRYVPDEDTCTCKVQYGRSFAVMIAMAVLVCVCSLVGGSYFGGGHNISPYKKAEMYRT